MAALIDIIFTDTVFLFEDTETQAWDISDLTFIGSDGLSFNPITRFYRSVRQQRLALTLNRS